MNKPASLKWVPVLCALLLLAAPGAYPKTDVDRTLSPYFVLDHSDPAIDQFPLKKTSAEVTISGVIAHVVVTQTYVNSGKRPINAKYVFPASTRAAVHGMKMTIGEHIIRAEIQERQQAQRTFDKAKKQGKSASLLKQNRPNVFSMDVANVMPGDKIDVELIYSELLVPTDGTYEFVYPTVVGPRYSELTPATATDADQWVQSPYLEEGKESETEFGMNVKVSAGIPIQEFLCPSHEVDINWESRNQARLALKPEEKAGGNRDFILRYRLAGKQITSGLMLYEGSDENFFLLMAQPPRRVKPENIPPREYIFIVDVSGSMHGFPLNVSKSLLKSLIGNLRQTDTFNVMLFSGTASVMSPSSVPATQENINRAIAVIDRQSGGGGTRLRSALEQAYDMRPGDEPVSRNFVVVTDGYISAERDVFTLIRQNLNTANVYAFGIGSSVNRHLIEGMAKAGEGEPFVVTNPGEAPGISEKFQHYIESPVLTSISVSYDGFEAYDIEPAAIPDLFANRPLLVYGKWRGDRKGRITVSGTTGGGQYIQGFDVSQTQASAESMALRYLWARARVAELSDFNFTEQNEETIREITTLGLTYTMLTAYTSFVAVHEVVRNTEGGAENVKQALPLPKGVSKYAVGGTRNVPEPDFYLMILLLSLGLAGTCLKRRGRSKA